MKILKSIAGVFVEQEETPKVVKPPVRVATEAVVQPVYGSRLGPEYEEFRKKFLSILEDENRRNYPGNDYFEFTVMKNAMHMMPQEELKYQAAFAGWRTGGNQTKQTLLDTAKIYLGLVDKEIADFEKVYQSQYDSQVGANQKLIEQKREQVAKLSEQIAKLNGEIVDLVDQSASNTQYLTQKHDAFMAAGEAQRQEILGEMEKINQYIN